MPRQKHESDDSNNARSQIDKFRELAREIGADEDEEAFKAKLRKVASAPRQPKPEKSE